MIISNSNVKKIVIFLVLTLCLIVATFISELNAYNNLLPTLSLLLILTILAANLYLNNNDYLSPLTVFSIMYTGYAIGGYYYAFSTTSFGKFVDYTGIPRIRVVELMQYALFYSLVCYILFVLGYKMIKTNITFNKKQKSSFWSFFSKTYMYITIPFLAIGLLHWYRVAGQTAGNLYNLFLYFQAFTHLAKDAGITTLPYHFYTAGIYVWLLGITVANKKIGIPFILFSILGMLIIITQGRITLAVTYLISQLVYFGLLNRKNKSKVLYLIVSLMLVAFSIFFLRMLSNNLFIGGNLSLSDLNFIELIIGGGNVADLQQLVIIFSTFDINSSFLGASYFDWMTNTFGGYFGITPASVGLTIKDLYLPDTSGAPTPGAIGEAYVNFNIAAPLIMFWIGAFFALIYNKAIKSGNVMWLLVYSIFLARFIFLYPKVDSTMMSNFFWGAAPLLIAILIHYIFFILLGSSVKYKDNIIHTST